MQEREIKCPFNRFNLCVDYCALYNGIGCSFLRPVTMQDDNFMYHIHNLQIALSDMQEENKTQKKIICDMQEENKNIRKALIDTQKAVRLQQIEDGHLQADKRED